MDISNLYDFFLASQGVSTDTRTLEPEQMYFALQGANFDGNRYAKQALRKGASLAVVDDPKMQDERIIVVDDSLATLQELARFHRKQFNCPFIGLTGSNGKTTSKELLVSVLEQRFKVGATKGNLNNHIGVPLTILSLERDIELAVIEMGANHQGEIAALSAIAQPDHGFITNYGKAHLEGFGGVEGVIKGKSELYDFLRGAEKTAWVHGGDSVQLERSQGIKRFTYGEAQSNDYVVKPLGPDPQGLVGIVFQDQEMPSNLSGAYNYTNLAVAAALGAYFGLTTEEIRKGIAAYAPRNNRSQFDRTGSNFILRDYYNANPSSMHAAIESFAGIERESKWVILGDMFEMGEAEAAEHQAVVQKLMLYPWEKVVLIGKAFAETEELPEALRFPTTDDAARWCSELRPTNKTVLIKGSRGMALEQIADLL